MPAFYFCLLFETESFYQRYNEYACKTCPKIKTTHGSHKCENRKKAALIWIWCDKSVKSKWENVIDTQATKFATACNLLVFAIFAKFIWAFPISNNNIFHRKVLFSGEFYFTQFWIDCDIDSMQKCSFII